MGTNGRSSAKDFLSAAATDAWVAEQAAKKRKEGFIELAASPVAIEGGVGVAGAAANPFSA